MFDTRIFGKLSMCRLRGMALFGKKGAVRRKRTHKKTGVWTPVGQGWTDLEFMPIRALGFSFGKENEEWAHPKTDQADCSRGL